MKSIKRIALLTVCFVLIIAVKVYATELSVSMGGDSTAKPGETKSATISVNSSDQEILSLSGIISVEGIDTSSVKVSGVDKWTITYNENTGNFIVYNADGSKDASVINITYAISENTADRAYINLDNLNITTLDYAETQMGSKSKEISIEKPADTPSDEPADEPQDEEPAGEVAGEKPKASKGEDTTTVPDKKIVQTGATPIILTSIIILGTVCFISYKKVKDYNY